MKKTSTINPKSKEQSLFDSAYKHINALYEQERYQESLDLCLQTARAYPKISDIWAYAAFNCAKLVRWQDAIGYAQTALARGGSTLALYDVLAHAYGVLGQWNQARRYGLQALNMRDRQFSGEPAIPWPEPGPMPPPPSAQTRAHNVIAFSLFGGDSKYCETAVLNVQEQPQVYPYWTCRFYVDGGVPEHVLNRLRAGGAQVVQVNGPALQWPGPMWRLLALDDPQAQHILFRDADSVISPREAAAVEQWLASGKCFHMMRDWCSHTELIMAGLWSVVAGSLPPLDQLMQSFLNARLESRHFADQYFLRQYVWPYARTSLMQHDSVFGFMDAAPFPDVKMPEGFHVGCAEGDASFTVKTDLPNGADVVWELYLIEKSSDGQPREELVCSYPGTVKDGAVSAPIPARYAQRIGHTARVRLFTSKATQHHAIQAKAQSQINTAVARIRAFQAQGRYQQALDVCLQVTRAYPEVAGAWSDAAMNCAHLGRWQDAIGYAQTALARGGNGYGIYDVLAHAHGKLGQWDEVRCYGLEVLNKRDREFGGEPAIPWPGPVPIPPPSAQTREHNVIAFSLFGGDPKYCETAVLNVQDQPQVYPHWVCRFYVDGSVPENVIGRLRAGGAQIVLVEGPALQWPGEMWRLLALDDPQAHRILFRDADSVISPREAAAVEQWLTSGKRFHMMRDSGSHTELMMAGLWGAVAGSLPPLEQLMARFLSAPLQSRHFADQLFLRQYVWPYARASLMQHDSIFGFMDAAPFPDGERPEGFHVGDAEGTSSFAIQSDQPDGAAVTWVLYQIVEKLDNNQARAKLVCSYTDTVHHGVVKAHIPARYARWIQQGTAQVQLFGHNAPTPNH